MFDIGWNELLVLLVIGLLVIGPKDIPKALHTAGKWMGAVRKVARDFQRHVDDAVREAELDDLKKGVEQARKLTVRGQLEKVIDPDGSLRNFKVDPGDGDKSPVIKAPDSKVPDSKAPAMKALDSKQPAGLDVSPTAASDPEAAFDHAAAEAEAAEKARVVEAHKRGEDARAAKLAAVEKTATKVAATEEAGAAPGPSMERPPAGEAAAGEPARDEDQTPRPARAGSAS